MYLHQWDRNAEIIIAHQIISKTHFVLEFITVLFTSVIVIEVFIMPGVTKRSNIKNDVFAHPFFIWLSVSRDTPAMCNSPVLVKINN